MTKLHKKNNFSPNKYGSDPVTADPRTVALSMSENQNTSGDLKMEDVLRELGGFSWFQAWATFVVILPEIPSAMTSVAPVFTGTSNVEFTCSSNITNLGVDSFGIRKTIYSGMDSYICSSNCSSRQPFGATYESVVQEWDMVCDRAWITDTCLSIQMAGMMLGALITSFIADRYGRKRAFYLMNLITAVFGSISGVVPDVFSYAAARFLSGVGVGGFYVVYNIYLIEFLTPSWRTICGSMSIWFVGELVLSLLAYFIKSWRILTLVTSLPAFLIFLTYPFIPESPRWLLCRGRVSEATDAMNQIARWNSKPGVDTEMMKTLQKSVLNEEPCSENEKNKTPGVVHLLRNSELRLKLGLFLFGWFACAVVYYGITFNVKNLSGDPYLNLVYMSLVDFVGFPFGALFNNWIGRKKTYSASFVFGAVFLLGIVIAEKAVGLSTYPDLITVFCFLGKFGVSAAWGVLVCFTAESFPTVVRSSCLGLCSLAANVGGVLAPQLAFLGIISPTLPYYIFCGLTGIAAGSSWFLGETNGKVLKNFIS